MMQGIKRMRRLKMGLRTLMGSRPEGFFIPYRYAAEMPPPGSRAAYDTVAARFDALIVPVAAVGAEEGFDMLLDAEELLSVLLVRLEAPPALADLL